MTRYFFDFREENDLILDEEGVELPSLERAKLEAGRAIAERARDMMTGNGTLVIAVEVRSDKGHQFTSSMVLETTAHKAA